jgi:gamma-glutamylputrescine oxidase
VLASEDALIRNSYYTASAPAGTAAPSLAGETRADVCVVGGGFAGLSAAIELARRGYSVVLLEAERVGWGASGRNGGQAIVGHASDEAIEAQLGAADARRAWDVTVDGLQLLRERIADYKIDCEFVPGYLSLAVNARKASALRQWQETSERAYGYPHWRWIDHGDIGNWIASPRFHAGLHDALSGHLHPLKYCLGLAAAARAAGVRIFEHSRVTGIERAAQPLLLTAAGAVRCDFVVLAGNVYLGGLVPALAARIMPVGTYIVATEPLPHGVAGALVRDRAAVCDTNFVLDYFRPSRDDRLLFGGRVSYSTMTPPNLARSMKARMRKVFPQISADITIDFAWGGFVDITISRAPDFGRVAPNIFYLQGFSGHGVALTGMAGRLVAEAIAGQAERFDLYARLRHRAFPGGRTLRTPALVLGMLYYRLRDLL